MVNNDNEEIKMLNYIEDAIRYSHGGLDCDVEYKIECLAFFESLIDSILP